MKYLLLLFAVVFLTPLPVRWTQPHHPIQPQSQVTSGIDHQQPTGDPPPQPPEKYPGQREHAAPPDGWNCMRQDITLSVPEEQACTCERSYDPIDPTVIREDRECSVWSHPMSCHCGISGHHPDALSDPVVPPPVPGKPPHDHH